jgi:hypothetical protein
MCYTVFKLNDALEKTIRNTHKRDEPIKRSHTLHCSEVERVI